VHQHVSVFTTKFGVILVGLGGLEPPTSPLSGVRSNHLSYRPRNSHIATRHVKLSLSISRLDNSCEHLPASCAQFKEVIQPQVPLGLPCYDFTPVMNHTVVIAPLTVRLTTSGAIHSHGVTGGVYKARERIHRDILIRDY
jgi:hypothetical protein